MKDDDYGFYGKGLDGYVHYKQAFDESQKSHSTSQHTPYKAPDKKPDSASSYVWDRVATVLGAIIFFRIIISIASYMP